MAAAPAAPAVAEVAAVAAAAVGPYVGESFAAGFVHPIEMVVLGLTVTLSGCSAIVHLGIGLEVLNGVDDDDATTMVVELETGTSPHHELRRIHFGHAVDLAAVDYDEGRGPDGVEQLDPDDEVPPQVCHFSSPTTSSCFPPILPLFV